MAKARILVVDDEANARAALRTILSEEGYEISEAADGEAGLARIAELSPDVVLADVRMPKMDGLALLRQAKEQGSDASFVMMTAFASVEAAVEAMGLGAENYMVKPLNVKAVLVFKNPTNAHDEVQAEVDKVQASFGVGEGDALGIPFKWKDIGPFPAVAQPLFVAGEGLDLA